MDQNERLQLREQIAETTESLRKVQQSLHEDGDWQAEREVEDAIGHLVRIEPLPDQ